MNKKISISIVFLGICLFVGMFLYSQKNREEKQKIPSEKINIVVTFYPLQYFAEKVGGDLVNVITLTPSGGEPHDYEPTPQDIIHIKTSDLFVFNGANFEPWTTSLLPQLTDDKKMVLNMSTEVDLLQTQDTDEEHGVDPHFWLDPVRAQKEVGALRETLSTLDPDHASTYEQNAEKTLSQLTALQKEFEQGLTSCEKKEIITAHNAFHYLGQRFQFTVESIGGFSPDQDPSPKHIAELAQVVQAKNIHYLFTETLASPKFVNTLATEAQVQTLVLNPLEGLTAQDVTQGKDYVSIMRDNLHNLRIAMECK